MAPVEFQNNLVGFQKSLMNYAYSLTSNREDAKDLVQETFLKALLYHDKFTYESSLKHGHIQS